MIKNPALVVRAFRVASDAFAHQTPDGGFSSTGGLTEVQQASAAAFFIQDFAHSIVLLQHSDWFETSAQTADLRTQLADFLPPLRRAMDYLVTRRGALFSDTGGANRILIYAVAYYLGGEALNSNYTEQVEAFIDSALARQSADGTFLELGGFDSSYQNVSLYEAQLLYLNMAPNAVRRAALWSAIMRGFSREEIAVDASSGRISTAGNTRVGLDSRPALAGGARHQLDPIHASLAFTYYAGITGDPRVRQLANAIMGYYFHIASPQ